ncbi:MAG: hypothetical protein J6D02_05335 [Lachnospira sp.]|nr:hypothetical protein [Lachnospira sp.]
MDKKAKRILFQTYWSGKGWKQEYTTTPDDFMYAREQGLMFDPLTIGHDDCVKRILEIAGKITQQKVVKAFLSSLSTRRLDWRSGIGSYYIAKQLPLHHYVPKKVGYFYQDNEIVDVQHACQICQDVKYGVTGYEYYTDYDLNVLNFERIKWGGVRHGALIYVLFDLEQFEKESIPEPTQEDIFIFKSILSAIDSLEPGDYPGTLRDKLKEIVQLKSNKGERDVLIEILALIGVLKPLSYDRAERGRHDWTFVTYWRGEDGYDKEAVEKYFGEYLK